MIKKLMTARRFIAAGMLTAFMFVGIASVNAQLSDGLIGYWPLDEGDGTTAANSAGGEDAELHNGVEWVDDPDRGVVLSFDGVDAYADAGAETIPQMTQDNDFTWSVWINQAGGNGPNDVVLGNRYGPEGTDFAPREFIKFTPTKFEFHLDGGGQNCEFDDLANSEGEWIHHVVVKTGDTFTHYTNGIEDESSTFTSELQNPQPFYFGGDQANENWNGMLDDIAIWDRALSADEVGELTSSGIPKPGGGAVPLVPGLIAYWPFDGDLDDAVGDSHGTGQGAEEISYTDGQFGQGIALDGVDQFVETPVENEEMFDFQDGTGFSISAWFTVDSFNKSWQALIAKGEGNRWRVHRRGGENILTGNGGNGDVPAGGTDVTGGEIHHLVLVSDPDGDEVRFYIDGELEASNAGPAVQSNDFPMMIGENPDARGRTWHGMIDDVGVWDRPISEDEVASIWNGGDGAALMKAGGGAVELVPELIAYWPFDSASDLVDKVAGIEGEAQGTVDDAEGHLGGAVDFGAGNTENWIKVDAEANTWLAAASDNDALSVSFWQKLHVVKSSSTIWFRAEAAGANARNFQAHVPWGNNAIYFDTAGCCDGGTQRINKAAEIDFLEWHHFVFVKDGENKSIWIDGELFHEGVNTTALFDDWTYFAIGSSGTDVFADAIVDDLGVWARGITADEVAAIYNDGAGAPLISAGTAVAKPRLAGMVSNAVGFSFQVKDVDGATVDPESIVVNFDGADVDVTKSKAEGVTAVSYESAELLAADSVHIVKVSVTDTNGNSTKLEKEFTVKPYTSIDTSVALPDSMKGESGFLVYATQISVGQMDVGELHGNQWVNAEKQINGGYIDVDTEEQYLNEADMDSFEGWSYYPEIVQVVNQNQDAPGEIGNFKASNGYEDEPITGIPGWGDSTDGIASEYIALLELERGAYKFGVNSDDGFNASFGANFGDLLAQTVGMFNGGRGASNTDFEIFVDKPGLYPYRVAWWEGGGGANIEIYSYVNGEKTLINDPDVEGSIKAYTIKGAVVDESTTVRATTGRAKVLSVSPAPGDTMVKSSEVVVTVQNEDTTVKQDTVVLSLNGEAVDASVSKSGDIVTISYSPDSLPVGAHTASLSFEESNGITRATEWSFEVPGLYARSGDVPAEPEGLISIREYHGVGGTSIAQLMGAANFPDSPDVSTLGTYFEWPASGDIEVPPAGNVRDNYGTHMMGYIYPPETGEYIFALACDDNGQLWLSTDESPANAKLIASQGGWQPVRDYRAETTSSEIFLEAGQVYFIEAFVNEGGGGDNLAVAWSLPEDGPSAPEPGALPISSDYLSPYSSVLDGPRTPILNSNGPSGAAIADTASISATFNNRGVAFTEVSVSVNGAVVDHTLATDGGTTTITANPGGAKGMVNVTLSWNGESKSWSYFGHDELGDGPNPIGFWDFNLDMGSGTTIDSVYGLVGELRNDAAFTDDAHDGMAMDFTAGGNQHVHVAAGEFLNIASSVNTVTVAFWQKNYSIPTTSSFWAEPGRAMQAHVPWSNGEIYWDTAGCCDGGTQRINANAADIGGWVDGDVETDEMLDTWHHYVFIKNEDAKEIWIDGELFHDGDNTNPLPTDINFLNIGGDQNGNNSLRGVIDDFAVFASALDEDQIIALAEGDRSILPAAPTTPLFVSASPDTATADGSADLSVTLYKRGDDASNAQLSVNGQDVATEVSTDGTTITITGAATGLASGTASATVSYNGISNTWSISVPDSAVNNGDGTITFQGNVAWEWWDGIGGAHPMEALTDNASYPDSPSGATFAPSWNTRTALAGGFDGNGRDNYGGRMSGVLTAPESGTYRFFIASDDHGLLRISTDADPANAVRVAEETGCCKNFTLDDGGLSGTVDLVEGQQYYMEALLKEGGGGDWMTVGWRMPSEDIDSVPAGNQEGIPGKYFTGKVTVPALPALSSSVSPGNDAVDVAPDGSITLSITEGATTVVVDSVSISLNGTALVHTATEGSWSRSFSIVTQEGKTHSITAPTGKLGGGSQNTITVTFTDSAGTVTTIESSFRVKSYHIVDMAAAGTVKYIEAEDFDFDGGSFKTFEEVGTGGSYEGLGAVLEVDLHNPGNSSPNYRVIEGNHPGMADSSWDSGRNGFSMEVDFKMGWNDAGDWFNYTRDFPEGGTYAVFGRFSSGGNPVAVDLSVVTEGQGSEDQALESVGTFTGPATGGWDTMKFFPLNDEDGELAAVSLSGTSTVRLTILPGNVDMNYLAFVPYEQAVLFSADPSTVKYIEVEDFDFDGGSFKTFEEVGSGGAYEGLGAVLEVDIHNPGNSSPNYRVIEGNHPGMADSSWDAERGGGNGFSMEVDFKMGWNDAGDWFNYTRDFPEDGSYAVYGRFSSGGNPVAVDLSVVTAGQGTEDQTLESAGTFTGPATGGWDTMAFFPLKDADGNLATVGLSGQSTVRLSILPGNVDMNYLAFVPYVGGGGGGGDGPALSVVNNGDGTVTITFEGTLQAAPTVNGPWENVDAPSPLTIPSDQAQQYGRAVTE